MQIMSTTTKNPQSNIFRKVPLQPDHKRLLGFTTRFHTSKIQEVHYHRSNFKINFTFSQIRFCVQLQKVVEIFFVCACLWFVAVVSFVWVFICLFVLVCFVIFGVGFFCWFGLVLYHKKCWVFITNSHQLGLC